MSDNAPSGESLTLVLPDPQPDGTNPFLVINWILFTSYVAARHLTQTREKRVEELGRKMRTENRDGCLMLHEEDDVDWRSVERALTQRIFLPWSKALNDARKLCAEFRIPFDTYDPLLKAAEDRLNDRDCIIRGVASDKEVYASTDIGKRLHELAASTTPIRPHTDPAPSNPTPSKRPAEHDWFGDAIKLFGSPSEDHRAQAVTEAAGIWIGYALYGEAIECDDRRTADEKHKLRGDLDYAHYKATEFLMMEAEHAGLNAAPLAEERRVCQELFRPIRGQSPASKAGTMDWFHHPKCISDHWPDCLGEWRYTLPPAMQAAIRQGEEVFTRLMVRLSMTPAVNPHIRDVIKQSEAGKQPAASPANSEPAPPPTGTDRPALNRECIMSGTSPGPSAAPPAVTPPLPAPPQASMSLEWHARRRPNIDSSAPPLERVDYWWTELADYLAITHGAEYAVRDGRCRTALYGLAIALVDAKLTDRVEALSDPHKIGGRTPAIELLKRAVLIHRVSPRNMCIDQELNDMFERVVVMYGPDGRWAKNDPRQSDLAHAARLALAHELRDEVLTDPRDEVLPPAAPSEPDRDNTPTKLPFARALPWIAPPEWADGVPPFDLVNALPTALRDAFTAFVTAWDGLCNQKEKAPSREECHEWAEIKELTRYKFETWNRNLRRALKRLGINQDAGRPSVQDSKSVVRAEDTN
jgi:hypothetical protein